MLTTFLLYGANGYSGELIARYASQYNLHPVLAGRGKEAIGPLAIRFGLPYRIFDVNDKDAVISALKEVKAVLNAAGPFDQTARQLVEACLQTGTHYIDINGDISVFELVKGYDAEAKKAGILLLPGAGFDVVPTDCLAVHLKNRMPDAVSLKLAFATDGGALSHGTATTIANRSGEGGAVRRAGKIINEPLGKRGRWVDFGTKKIFVMSIPWGDISTAHFSTGIPDIICFTGMPRKIYYLLKIQWLFNWELRTEFIRKKLKAKINRLPAGPSDSQRAGARGYVWGEAANAAGRKITARLTGPEGYTITVHASLIITQKVLNGDFKAGYGTPASVWGEGLIKEIPGISSPDNSNGAT